MREMRPELSEEFEAIVQQARWRRSATIATTTRPRCSTISTRCSTIRRTRRSARRSPARAAACRAEDPELAWAIGGVGIAVAAVTIAVVMMNGGTAKKRDKVVMPPPSAGRRGDRRGTAAGRCVRRSDEANDDPRPDRADGRDDLRESEVLGVSPLEFAIVKKTKDIKITRAARRLRRWGRDDRSRWTSPTTTRRSRSSWSRIADAVRAPQAAGRRLRAGADADERRAAVESLPAEEMRAAFAAVVVLWCATAAAQSARPNGGYIGRDIPVLEIDDCRPIDEREPAGRGRRALRARQAAVRAGRLQGRRRRAGLGVLPVAALPRADVDRSGVRARARVREGDRVLPAVRARGPRRMRSRSTRAIPIHRIRSS